MRFIVTDDFGNSLFVARPGTVVSVAHEVAQRVGGGYCCVRCGKSWKDFSRAGSCSPHLEFASSGWGSKEHREKSLNGEFSWVSPN